MALRWHLAQVGTAGTELRYNVGGGGGGFFRCKMPLFTLLSTLVVYYGHMMRFVSENHWRNYASLFRSSYP